MALVITYKTPSINFFFNSEKKTFLLTIIEKNENKFIKQEKRQNILKMYSV